MLFYIDQLLHLKCTHKSLTYIFVSIAEKAVYTYTFAIFLSPREETCSCSRTMSVNSVLLFWFDLLLCCRFNNYFYFHLIQKWTVQCFTSLLSDKKITKHQVWCNDACVGVRYSQHMGISSISFPPAKSVTAPCGEKKLYESKKLANNRL